MNITVDGAMYPSQNFPFGAAFVCEAGNVWTHHRIIAYLTIITIIIINIMLVLI